MKIENFKSGRWEKRFQYKSFEPEPINHEWTWDSPAINVLLENATRAISELNAFSLIVPDIDLFIEMHVTKEAQTSSRIEGTATAMDEALMPKEQVSPERRDDWQEVRNYVDAVNLAVQRLADLPLSNRLLRETHAVLMRGVRGEHKAPGEFRTSQNWIGGSSIADAAFIPPHHENLHALMADLENFWHNDHIQVPHLIRAAISHYQFETIHPFLDGNGRIGRLLIPLYLISGGLLAKPSLYLSDFFERNRASYYDALTRVRTSHDLDHWVRFFLSGLAETATKGRDTFQQILKLKTEMDHMTLKLGRKGNTIGQIIPVLYRHPILNAAILRQTLQMNAATANNALRTLVQQGVLVEVTGQLRHRIFVFQRYLGLFSG